ncbi:response regulator [Lentibacter algarum]|uniref:hybrid sensor histidine kinase/response regulator n=1 Tax=Lentibacter algarum TaxID=576131 RepID=UPI001C07AE5F|nr:ATP-binding protein [Lentibacter algarum]MBU2981361.1 response regulator [Lentibacter algarum]
MATELETAKQRLSTFEARHCPEGLLLRYAHNRVTYFWLRLTFNLAALPVFFFTEHPLLGWLAIALASLGEATECGYLKSLPKQLEKGVSTRRLYRRSTGAAFAHTIALSAIVLLPVAVEASFATLMFSLSYLVAVGINAAFSIGLHKAATYTRLIIISLLVIDLFAIHIYLFDITPTEFWFSLLAVTLSAFTVYSFLSQMRRTFGHTTATNREILQQNYNYALAHQELREREAEVRQLALVAKHANDSIFISNPDRQIVWLNDAFTKLTGYSREEALGQHPAALLNGTESNLEASAAIGNAVAAGNPLRTEVFFQKKTGDYAWVETNQVPVLGEDGTVEMVIAIERDITDAKNHAAELASAKLAAEEGERAKTQFLATMSHEIRTPMNGIIGMADLLAESTMAREHRSYVDTIRTSAEALLRIINDILDYSKLDAGKTGLAPSEFNLLNCVQEALNILQPKALEKGIFVDLTCTTPVPDLLFGDAGRIRQILINIVGNAIKFTQNGGVTLQLSCHERDNNVDVTLTVKDSGIGIAPEQFSQIFEQFNQAENDISRKFGGTGLGLTISRSLAREMGGDVSVTSEPDHGSTFTITLSLAPASRPKPRADTPSQTAAPTVTKPLKLPGIKALVAEDNATNQLLMKSYLKDSEMEVLYARNGHEAVKLAKRHTPRVIFMDISMPGMDGIEATRIIRKADITQPTIIALTANAFASDKAACLNAGMDGFLTKPLKRSDLISWLSQL